MDEPLNPREGIKAVREGVGARIVGNDEAIDHMLICLFARGHILVESPPGLGKTEISKTISQMMDMSFRRIQSTPDLRPSDVVGETITESGTVYFRRGPIFTNILLVDEINRACPKTQSAFLEAMSEGGVSAAGQTHELPKPFMVIATQNPIEYAGTYPLPEAQQDRFLLKTLMTYLNPAQERQVVKSKRRECELMRVFNQTQVVAIQSMIEESVNVPDEVYDLIVDVVSATRTRREVLVGASTRCSVLYGRAVRAKAFIDGRCQATRDDVVALAHPILRHRIVMNPDSQNFGFTSDDLVDDVLRKIMP